MENYNINLVFETLSYNNVNNAATSTLIGALNAIPVGAKKGILPEGVAAGMHANVLAQRLRDLKGGFKELKTAETSRLTERVQQLQTRLNYQEMRNERFTFAPDPWKPGALALDAPPGSNAHASTEIMTHQPTLITHVNRHAATHIKKNLPSKTQVANNIIQKLLNENRTLKSQIQPPSVLSGLTDVFEPEESSAFDLSSFLKRRQHIRK